MVITIDGPTASGKSTIAALLAQKLGCYYLNTGFLYRAISYLLMNTYGYTLDTLSNPDLADICAVLDPTRFEYTYKDGQARIMYDGKDITPFLKTKDNDQAASIVSGSPMVRNELLEYQRHFTKNYDVIAEGRDTGTVIFPHADIKIYLTASLEERALRWQRMQSRKGAQYTLEQALEQVAQRDERDSSRPIAPLAIPEGARVVDSTNLDQQQTVDLLISIIQSKRI